MIPVLQPGYELPQIFTDMRLSDTLKWRETVVIGEESVSKYKFLIEQLPIRNWAKTLTSQLLRKRFISHGFLHLTGPELFEGVLDSLSRPALHKDPLAITVVRLSGPVAMR